MGTDRLIQSEINGLIEDHLGNGGTLTHLSAVLGINLSTLWRYRTKGFKDPYAAYLIAKTSGQTEESAQDLAKRVSMARGAKPDAPYQRRNGPAERMREQLREIVIEEVSRVLATKAC